MKVLIAEDDSTSAIVLRKALEKLGHEAVVAKDGESAYAMLKEDSEFAYRVVISDWMMPGMDGLELTRKLRAERQPGDPYRYIVLLTARGRPEDRRQGLDAGADDFMVKPLDMGDLIPRLSVAQRMLALEDAIAASRNGNAASSLIGAAFSPPGDKAHPVLLDDGKPPLTEAVSTEDQAACTTLFSALIDSYKATQVHFEPVADETYRVRIRTAQDQSMLVTAQPRRFSGTIAYLEAFLQKSSRVLATLPLSPQREVQLQIDRMLYGGQPRYHIQIIRDTSAPAPASVSLESLPMSASVRERFAELLRDGYTHRGVLVLTAPVTSEQLLTQTANAVRSFFTNDQTVLMDDFEADSAADPDYLAQILRQAPDVCVTRSERILEATTLLSVGARTFLVVVLPYGTAAHCLERLRNSAKLWTLRSGHLLGLVGISPLLPDATNAGDRYELKTTDELPGT